MRRSLRLLPLHDQSGHRLLPDLPCSRRRLRHRCRWSLHQHIRLRRAMVRQASRTGSRHRQCRKQCRRDCLPHVCPQAHRSSRLCECCTLHRAVGGHRHGGWLHFGHKSTAAEEVGLARKVVRDVALEGAILCHVHIWHLLWHVSRSLPYAGCHASADIVLPGGVFGSLWTSSPASR